SRGSSAAGSFDPSAKKNGTARQTGRERDIRLTPRQKTGPCVDHKPRHESVQAALPAASASERSRLTKSHACFAAPGFGFNFGFLGLGFCAASAFAGCSFLRRKKNMLAASNSKATTAKRMPSVA